MDAGGEGFSTRRLDGSEAIGQHRRQNLDHLTVAVVRALQLAPGALQAGRQRPILKWRSVAQRAGLPGEHRYVMPRIIDRRAATETAAILADNRALLADHDAGGRRLDLDRPTDRA